MPVVEFLQESPTPTALIIASGDAIVPARRSAPLRKAIPNLVLDRTIHAGHNEIYDQHNFAVAFREALAAIAANARP